jgi:hypothetical protein
MAQAPRKFESHPAVRERVPLLIGLTGPSGSGKTYSALRLATGIQRVSGGKVFGIDTEARRMLHYAEMFKFDHLPFVAPFGSLDYLAALEFCVSHGAKTIIVDSGSHEHEGVGGMIDAQEAELQRMAGDDWQKRERVKMLAWVKPKQARRRLINGILQINANIIFCFRAKNTSKPVKANGKTEVVPQGYVAVSGDEFIFEMMLNCLLLPKSGGVPTWASDNPGEAAAMKLPEQFKSIFAAKKPLDEDIGAQLATWAAGGVSPTESREKVAERLRREAGKGESALRAAWESLTIPQKQEHKDALPTLKEQAKSADTRPPAPPLAISDPDAQPPDFDDPAPPPDEPAGELFPGQEGAYQR